MQFVYALSAFVLVIALTWISHPALRLSPRMRLAVLIIIAGAICATPLWILTADGWTRFLLGLVCLLMVMKLVDAYRDASRNSIPTFAQFRAYVRNALLLVRRREGFEAQPPRGVAYKAVAKNLALLAGSLAIFVALFFVDWTDWGFALEHVAKTTVIFFTWLCFMSVLAFLTRMAGMYSVEPNDSPFASVTPAQFWRRYNRWMGMALHENVFKPVGGMRHPVRGVVAAFIVSGFIHEYLFGVAIGRVQGYQSLFFAVQGIAVIYTMRLRLVGVSAVLGVCATYAFNMATAVLFCASVQQLAPYYQNPLPPWLRGW